MAADRGVSSHRENLSRYLREIHSFPLLTAEAEQALFQRWRERHDISAIVNTHAGRLIAAE